MSTTTINVEQLLADLNEPNIVIIGAWHDTRANIPTAPDVDHHTPVYLPENPRHNIWCVEPMPHCVASLLAARAKNPRIRVVPCAVGDRNSDSVPFFQHPAVDMTNSLRPHAGPAPAEGPITVGSVAVRTLDGLWSRGELPGLSHYVTLDVQGCAREAIAGGREFFQHVAMLWAEVEFEELYQGQALYPEVRELLEGLGFVRVTTFTEQEMIEKWGDALFVNRRWM